MAKFAWEGTTRQGEVRGSDRLGAGLLGGLGGGLVLDRVDLRDENLLAPQRRDRRLHRVGDALAGHRLPGA